MHAWFKNVLFVEEVSGIKELANQLSEREDGPQKTPKSLLC